MSGGKRSMLAGRHVDRANCGYGRSESGSDGKGRRQCPDSLTLAPLTGQAEPTVTAQNPSFQNAARWTYSGDVLDPVGGELSKPRRR